MLDRDNLEEVKLTLSRLNGLWSFTGQPLCWKVDVMLRPLLLHDDVDILLQCVTAYAALAAAAGDAIALHGNPPDEWTRLFNEAGSTLLFDMPYSLSFFERRHFEKLYSKCFVQGFMAIPSPLSPSPL